MRKGVVGNKFENALKREKHTSIPHMSIGLYL